MNMLQTEKQQLLQASNHHWAPKLSNRNSIRFWIRFCFIFRFDLTQISHRFQAHFPLRSHSDFVQTHSWIGAKANPQNTPISSWHWSGICIDMLSFHWNFSYYCPQTSVTAAAASQEGGTAKKEAACPRSAGPRASSLLRGSASFEA